jgi:hypothetical protein
MTLIFQDDSIRSDRTDHTACLALNHERGWRVSWLPGRLMDRNSAITAMVLADIVSTGEVKAGHRLWPHVAGWAVELGLTARDAVAWTSQAPGRADMEKGAAVPEDLEAAGS